MKFDINNIYNGFKCVKTEFIDDIKSDTTLLKHEKSGAELMVVKNDDENKVFALCFSTPVDDSTGVPHIIEHSVLNGSKKFKVKDPFAEMLKTSLASFINAFTFSDKTMYPVASKNEKDLMNLMDLYMDSVFFPTLSKETFLQEGWHYHLTDKNNQLEYKGVVYNEMKGVFSSADSIIDNLRNEALFPDTTYKYVSGGDPKIIPELTYENFIKFHKEKYHPSNCKMIIYGNGNILKQLEFIDKEYLSKFDLSNINIEIKTQKKITDIPDITGYYPLSKEESMENKGYLLTSYLLDEVTNEKFDLSFSILSAILTSFDSSPLRRAVVDAEIGESLYGGEYNNYIKQGIFDIGIRGNNTENQMGILTKEKFKNIVNDCFKDCVKNGLDKELIKASINRIEFQLREANFGDFPKGIVYFIESMRNWLYGKDPFSPLKFQTLISEIKKDAENGYFESMIEKYLIKNNHKVTVLMVPDKNIEDKNTNNEKELLQNIKSSFNNIELENIIEESILLEKLQITPNSKEDLDTLPKLDISEITIEPVIYPITFFNKNLYENINTNGIVYFTATYDFSDFNDDELPYISVLAQVLEYLGSTERSAPEIEKELGIYTGGIDCSRYITQHEITKNNICKFFISGKSTTDNFKILINIIAEITQHLNCENISKIKELVLERKNNLKNSILSSGHATVKTRIASILSETGKKDEIMGGITHYKFLESLLKFIEKEPDKVILNLQYIVSKLFKKENLICNVTCDNDAFNKVETLINSFSDSYGNKIKGEFFSLIPLENVLKNQGLIAATQVQYVGIGANLGILGFEPNGKLNVLKKIIDIDFLWQNIRLKGGAYGGFSSYNSINNEWYFISYRDPNLQETIKVYKESGRFLRDFKITKEELEKTIIGAFQPIEKPILPDKAGMREYYRFIRGVTKELLIKDRLEALSITPEDINNYGVMFEKMAENGIISVIGNKEKIENAASQFESIVNIFED